MTTVRSTWWSVTAFKDAEMEALANPPFPYFVAHVFGGLEKCPTTGKIHFQGAVQCHEQVRMSALKHWLPTAHLEKALHTVALKKYVMKAETAIEEKREVANTIPHFSADRLCLMLANIGLPDRQTDFYVLVNRVLRDNPGYAGQLMNPSLRNFWDKTCSTWIAIVLQRSCFHKDGSLCIGCEHCENGQKITLA